MKDALSAVSRSFIIYMYIGVTIRKSCISEGFHITVAACVGRLLSFTFPEIGSGRCDLRVRNLSLAGGFQCIQDIGMEIEGP